MSSKQLTKQIISKAKNQRINLNFLNFMDRKISQQFNPFAFFSICGSRSSFKVPSRFETAFMSMNELQRAQYYLATINNCKKRQINAQKQALKNQLMRTSTQGKEQSSKKIIEFKLFIQEKSLWKEKHVTIHNCIAKINNELEINLMNYIVRKSKKKQKKCIVFQSIECSHNDVLRASFSNNQQYQKNVTIISQIMNQANYKLIQSLTSKSILKTRQIYENERKDDRVKTVRIALPEQQQKKVSKKNMKSNHSIVSEILKDENNDEFNLHLPQLIDEDNELNELLSEMNKNSHNRQSQTQHIQKKSQKTYPNIFSHIMPCYNLKQLSDLTHFRPISKNFDTNLYIYKSNQNHELYKLELISSLKAQTLVKIIYNVDYYKVWHSEVIEGQMKMLISSQNTAIMYQKHKRYSQWYKQRDFIYLRHLFKLNDQYYLVDKSIQNTNFMPFNSIVRGQIHYVIWKIKQNVNGCILTAQICMNHVGLNEFKRQQLTVRYLEGFQRLNTYFNYVDMDKKLKEYLKLYWTVSEHLHVQQPVNTNINLVSVKTTDFKDQEDISGFQDQDIFYSIKNNSILIQDQISQHEIEVQNQHSKSYLLKLQSQKIQLDQNGLTILPKTYLLKKHNQDIIDIPAVTIKLQHNNILLKDDWSHQENGGLKLINKNKIQAQSNVVKFMMRKLRENIFSGKGLSGVSLPVDVFSSQSNLQRSALALCLAPYFIQMAAKQTSYIQRFKYIISFGISNLLLSLNIQKPFNPILGQTYQGHIAGNPVYGQQISHHPPISSIYFIGKGYKIYGNIQPKADIGINSGTGINEGYLTIQFDDNQKVQFQGPSWQLSGLTIGQVKLAMKGKSYYIDRCNLLYSEVKFEQFNGIFTKNKWKYIDQMQGEMMKVTQGFMRNFTSSKSKTSPSKGDIIQSFYKIEGRWPISLTINGETTYIVNQHLPYQLTDYPFPLNSNSNYREDIVYRKIDDISRCQIEKDRLENLQRNDKKLRQKHHQKTH